MSGKSLSEEQLDQIADDGRLGIIAKRMAVEAGIDWPSLNGEDQDVWHERAIELLRSGTTKARRYLADAGRLS